MHRALALVVAILTGLPSVALAQGEPAVEARGTHSIFVGVGSYGYLGYWLRIGSRVDLGLESGVQITDAGDVSFEAITVRPAVKTYLSSRDDDVAPYMTLGLIGRWSTIDATSSTRDRDLGGYVGLGIDWFPHQRVSVGGHLAIEGIDTRQEQEPVPPSFPGASESGYQFRTFTSGLRLQLYF